MGHNTGLESASRPVDLKSSRGMGCDKNEVPFPLLPPMFPHLFLLGSFWKNSSLSWRGRSSSKPGGRAFGSHKLFLGPFQISVVASPCSARSVCILKPCVHFQGCHLRDLVKLQSLYLSHGIVM